MSLNQEFTFGVVGLDVKYSKNVAEFSGKLNDTG